MDLFSYLLGKKAGGSKGTTVIANPELTGTEADLTGLQVDETKYKIDNLEHYSTDEQVVGTWIDGKPVYRKTFEINDYGSNVNDNILASLDIFILLKSEWITWGASVFLVKNVGYNASTKLLYNKPTEWSVAFTVEYTKTTD